ncbi:tripartite tricarboxylate transporter TctB family protein [Vibrio lamellibrachiae]|uniref:tripartite tricarboxylate transporter TctB family protein n=1 Tax=Vibrio lamellibrachiae TaxID=2910253 RepID=UPI003D12540B
MRKAHLISAVIFIFFSLVALYLSNELPDSRRGVPGPAVWPMIISCAVLISGCIFFIKTFRKTDSEALELINSDNIRVYITMGVLVGYLILMNVIGFVVTSLVLMFGLFTWFSDIPVMKRMLFSIAIVGMVYGVFNYALNVPFRFGILF